MEMLTDFGNIGGRAAMCLLAIVSGAALIYRILIRLPRSQWNPQRVVAAVLVALITLVGIASMLYATPRQTPHKIVHSSTH